MLSMNTTVHSVALYECDSEHYFEVGSNSMRICLESERWSTGDVRCCECVCVCVRVCECVYECVCQGMLFM